MTASVVEHERIKPGTDERGDIAPLTFAIAGMDCLDCARSVERVVAELPGVTGASVNFGAATLTVAPGVEATRDLPTLVAGAVERAGYRAEWRDQAAVPRARERAVWWQERRWQTTAFGALAWVVAFALARSSAPEWMADVVYAAGMVIAGWGFARAGLQALRVRRLDMNVLMTISAVGAAALGDWSEGAMVVVLFALGGTLQAATLDRTRGAIRALMDLSPPEALVVRDGIELVVPVAALQIGDRVRVKPGARLPADGQVVEGLSAVDQQAITGESLPVDKMPGDEVFAGTVNGQGTLLVEVTRRASDSTLAQIIHLVEEAQGSRAPSQVLIDRFAAVYTPAVIAGAFLLAVGGALFAAEASTWIYRALVLLVIACPCALVISTPVSIVAAIGAATRRGVLVKGGAALEAAGQARVVAFDKTGTLSEGRPAVTDVLPLADLPADEILALAAAVETLSEHPIGKAVVAQALHDAVPIPQAHAFTSLPGLGARAAIGDRRVTVGSARLFAELNDDTTATHLRRLATAGQTPLLVVLDGDNGAASRPVGIIAVADRPRPGAAEALRQLRRVGVERIVVLTGDTKATGEAIAHAVGADEVEAELLPEEKACAVQALRERYGPIAMVGDGVNDAPALATADVGIAMGAAGSAVALETADLALMGDNLGGVANVLTLSRRTTRIIRQNITLSLAIKALALVLGAFGLVNLWIAVAADMGTSLAVTLNGLRLGLGSQESRNAIDE
jgi:Cd2+/Zn2+-exporting ATPase